MRPDNYVNLMGNLTKLSQLQWTKLNGVYLNFVIAVNRKRSFTKHRADFILCVAFGNIARSIVDNFDKGQMIAIGGEIGSFERQTSDGKIQTCLGVHVECYSFCGDYSRKKEAEINEFKEYMHY